MLKTSSTLSIIPHGDTALCSPRHDFSRVFLFRKVYLHFNLLSVMVLLQSTNCYNPAIGINLTLVKNLLPHHDLYQLLERIPV